MNITPFSPVFRKFASEAQLHLTSPRITPTWMPGLLNIDHVLVSKPDAVIDTLFEGWRFSDHRPVGIRYIEPKP